MGQLNAITSFITQLLTQHVGQFAFLGQGMFLSFATIVIVWLGVKSALSAGVTPASAASVTAVNTVDPAKRTIASRRRRYANIPMTSSLADLLVGEVIDEGPKVKRSRRYATSSAS